MPLIPIFTVAPPSLSILGVWVQSCSDSAVQTGYRMQESIGGWDQERWNKVGQLQAQTLSQPSCFQDLPAPWHLAPPVPWHLVAWIPACFHPTGARFQFSFICQISYHWFHLFPASKMFVAIIVSCVLFILRVSRTPSICSKKFLYCHFNPSCSLASEPPCLTPSVLPWSPLLRACFWMCHPLLQMTTWDRNANRPFCTVISALSLKI